MLDNNSLINFNKPIVEVVNHINIFSGRRRRLKRSGPLLIVDRFSALLAGHKLSEAQLLKLVPREWGWTLKDLSGDKEILAVLTPEKIVWLAELFGIEESWLEGTRDRIYHWLHGYKRVPWFIEQITERGWCNEELRMTILAADYKPGRPDSLNQFTIILSHPLAEWDNGETTIYRHECFDAGPLPWDHQPARVNALHLAHWFHHTANRHEWIPIVPCKYRDLTAITESKTFPGPFIPWGVGGYDQFEDRLID